MSLTQAISTALSGLNATQTGLSVISGNVANANTPGYVAETSNQIEVATVGTPGASVDVVGINRNLNAILESQLRTETSGGAFADTQAQLYQQLQQVYGTPGSAGAFDTAFNNFTTALQALSTSPSSFSAQNNVLGAAQQLTQNLNNLSSGIQSLRSQAEQGIATDVPQANQLLQQIAQLNLQLSGSNNNNSRSDTTTATLEDQRDQAITQLSGLLNVSVTTNSINEVSISTGNGIQLVSGTQAAQLSFDNRGTLSSTQLWNANSRLDGAGTITLTAPDGTTTDLLAAKAITSGRLAAYVQARDQFLPQEQSQIDELAAQISEALSNKTTSGTPVTSGNQLGFSVDIGGLLAGNTIQLSYTDGFNVQRNVTVVGVNDASALPLPSPPAGSGNQVIGVNLSGGIAGVVAQLNSALGANVQFSNPSGSVLQALNAPSNAVSSLSATTTATSLTSGSPQLPFFTDGGSPITGAVTSATSQDIGLAARISVNPALLANAGALVGFSTSPPTSSGDPTRPNFLLNQLTTATFTFLPTAGFAATSPPTGLGTSSAPFSGTLASYMSQMVNQQSQAANAATSLQQGQDVVVSALQQRVASQSGVNIDTEMANLITLQNAYSANARVMSIIQSMLSTLSGILG
jgi:flagellar hook-associated protein 1